MEDRSFWTIHAVRIKFRKDRMLYVLLITFSAFAMFLYKGAVSEMDVGWHGWRMVLGTSLICGAALFIRAVEGDTTVVASRVFLFFIQGPFASEIAMESLSNRFGFLEGLSTGAIVIPWIYIFASSGLHRAKKGKVSDNTLDSI